MLNKKQLEILEEIDSVDEEKDSSIAGTARQGLERSAHLARELYTGIAEELLPQSAQDFLYDSGFTYKGEPKDITSGSARMIGKSLPYGIGAAYGLGRKVAGETIGMLSSQAQRGLRELPYIGRFLEPISKSIRTQPGRVAAGEIAAAGAAGAAREAVPEEYPTAREFATFGGGMLGGAAVDLPTTLKRGAQSTLETIVPFSEEAGKIRAAKQMQKRAVDPEAAAEQVLAGKKGITPARLTGQDTLIAQEKRIIDEFDAQDQAKINQELKAVEEANIEELKKMAEGERSLLDWQQSVIQKVTAPGTVIEKNDIDTMLQKSYESFTPLYKQAHGQRIDVTNLRKKMLKSIQDKTILSGTKERKAISDFINSQFNSLESKIKKSDKIKEIDSEDLLEFRSVIRGKIREEKTPTERSKQYRGLLQNVETEITKTLENGLTPNSRDILTNADQQYRQYKIIENAAYKAAEKPFTSENVSSAIREASSSRSFYARDFNETEKQLRKLARTGRSVKSVLGNPEDARNLIKGFSDEELKSIKSEFVRLGLNNSLTYDDIAERNIISVNKLNDYFKNNVGTARALKFTDDELNRINNLNKELLLINKKPDVQVARLFEDEVATFANLLSTLAGAKTGSRFATDLGSGLVLSQFFAANARRLIANLTFDKATQLLQQSVTDPQLYAALLTKDTASLDKKKESARIIQSWLLANSPPETLPDVEGVVRKFTEETEEQPTEGFDRRQLEILEGL
tara:strand:- start:55 stop:2283 length:2229 start_codon:yes stop_codon:yes gene_type:complete